MSVVYPARCTGGEKKEAGRKIVNNKRRIKSANVIADVLKQVKSMRDLYKFSKQQHQFCTRYCR